MRYILVPATGADTDAAVFAMALTTARKLSAHLEFLHVGMDVRETLAAMATADMAGGGGYGLVLDELEQEVSRRQRKAEQAFHDFCEGEGLVVSADPSTPAPTAEWRRETGDEPAWIATHGHAADLLVLGRASDDQVIDLLEAALMTSGRPVLIAPAKPPADLGRVVAIAWKDRPEAARAVTAAQPFLRRAQQVIIFSVTEEADADTQSCERLRHALSWQNPAVSVQRLRAAGRPAVDVLLAAAAAAKADLLVMGGYGHSRVREVIFGGFTRRVLRDADLPVLMSH